MIFWGAVERSDPPSIGWLGSRESVALPATRNRQPICGKASWVENRGVQAGIGSSPD